jgi:lipopolysaccharide cholinephosphotransferase
MIVYTTVRKLRGKSPGAFFNKGEQYMDLNIPNGFLDGEIRDGFYVEKMMKRNWACSIKMLAEIDRICKVYNLKYFADWGTLLGAARHKGFIPWDDDIDLAMLRDDYEIFNKVAKYEFPEGWEILNMHNEGQWHDIFDHVVTGRSVRYDKEHLDEYYGFPYVAGVDIFPYDYVPPTEEEERLVREVEKIAYCVAHLCVGGTDAAEEYEPMLLKIEQLCGVNVDRNGNISNQMFKLCESLSRMYSADEASHVAMMPEFPSVRKDIFDDMILLDFEYVKVPAPACYEVLLEDKYGKDWRTPLLIPAHEYPYYKKQIDKETINAPAVADFCRRTTEEITPRG